VVVADADQSLAKAVEVVHAGAGHHGEDTNAPTTFLVDGTGTVRWFARPERFITRLSPDDVLAAVDEAGRAK
jgi:peroxiredoxin